MRRLLRSLLSITAKTMAEDLEADLTLEINGVLLDIEVEVASTVTPD
jgi:hypothetical protein